MNPELENLLKMLYGNAKFKRVTSKLVLLPDDTFYNIDTHEVVDLGLNKSKSIKHIHGYINADFMYIRNQESGYVYNNDGSVLIASYKDRVKPRVYHISRFEWIFVHNNGTLYTATVYNDSIKAVTKHLVCFGVHDETDSLILSYMDNDSFKRLKLNIIKE